MKIAVVGIGYVGLSNALLLAQKNDITMFDIDEAKVNMINYRKSPFKDYEIEKYIKYPLNIKATTNDIEAFQNKDIIMIATPTNYDENKNYFDTKTIEDTIRKILQINKDATIIIKSTVPIGYTKKIKRRFGIANIIFMPEFLREGKALYDNLYPSRIIVGEKSNEAKKIVRLYLDCLIKEDVKVLYVGSDEAEAIKLFANTYLAMRVAFFNELDIFCESKNLNPKEVIKGVCLDSRIGMYYNNPSFGYGGYCLPKDTKQLVANYEKIPNDIMKAIIKSNDTRKKYISKKILDKNPKIVGIYRLGMKKGSDNFRCSAVLDIMRELSKNNIQIIIYEPTLTSSEYLNFKVINRLKKFKQMADLVLANRYSKNLDDIINKVYTRDTFYIN